MDPPPEDFCPIPPRMLLYPRGVFGGVLPLDIPGVLAVDLVGHDGGRVVGDFGWTLTVTDCTSR